MTEETILRKKKVLAVIGMGNTWLYDAIAKGQFPKPVKLGSRAVGWRRSEVEAWLSELDQDGPKATPTDCKFARRVGQ